MNAGSSASGWMIVPACSRQERDKYFAADQAAYDAGWRTNSSRFVPDGDNPAAAKSEADSLAARVTETTGHQFVATECLF